MDKFHHTHHLKVNAKRHAIDYILLITAGLFFLVSLNIFRGEKFIEFLVLMAFTSFYIIWGMYHHVIEDSVHLKSLLEYVFIGFTILFLVKIIIFP